MEKTYINPEIDRSQWGPGPWDGEPDKVSWTDEATGLPCVATRGQPMMGNWCGYVAVNPGHPYHGKPASEVPVDAHGGLNYSEPCFDDGPVERAVCHIPEPGQPADVWWFGFDAGHYQDVQPAVLAHAPELRAMYDRMQESGYFHPTYKTLAWVKAECARVAAQLKALDE